MILQLLTKMTGITTGVSARAGPIAKAEEQDGKYMEEADWLERIRRSTGSLGHGRN
jgi:hypothetical protein